MDEKTLGQIEYVNKAAAYHKDKIEEHKRELDNLREIGKSLMKSLPWIVRELVDSVWVDYAPLPYEQALEKAHEVAATYSTSIIYDPDNFNYQQWYKVGGKLVCVMLPKDSV